MWDAFRSSSVSITVILLWIWAAIAACALSQRILDINVLPDRIELIAKALAVDFTLIVIVFLALSLYLHIADIHTMLKKVTRGSEAPSAPVQAAKASILKNESDSNDPQAKASSAIDHGEVI